MPSAPSLFPTPRESQAPPGKGLHGYYRRGDNGWIVVASTTPANRSGYEYKGNTFLPQYGEFKNGTNEPRAKQYASDDRGQPWNPAVEPWRLILQRDGAKDFPIEQVIAYHWHITPPYKEVTFPQLEGVDITTYPCPECKKGIFSSVNPKEATEHLRAHLTSGVNKRHEYSATDLRELGEELTIDFSSGRVGRIEEVKEQMAATQESATESVMSAYPKMTPADPPEDPPSCECGWVSEAKPSGWPQSAAMHKNMHCPLLKKKEPVLAEA